MTDITGRLAEIRKRVQHAASLAGSSVMIVAVSKGQSTEAIRIAYAAGQRRFGESYVQEAVDKMDALRDLDLEWHFIGNIQANKTRLISERFQWVHTVARPKIAERLSDARPHYGTGLNVLIQVDQSRQPDRAGAAEPVVAELAQRIQQLPRLALRGLMTIPPLGLETKQQAELFDHLRALQARLAAAGILTDTLSMGMSADFEPAIARGSTCVRIGSAIFGPRNA